jgi:hypothetical protein
MKTTHEIIEDIVRSIEVTDARQLIFEGEPLVESYTFLPTEDITPQMLIKSISDLIYKHFYSKHSEVKSSKINNFTAKLRKANFQKSYWSKGWQIENINTDGSILVINNELRKRLEIGEFIKEIPIRNLEVGSKIKVYLSTELLTNDDAFFHIYGREVSDDFDDAVIRFYFNLTPYSAINLVELLSKNLIVPYHFKCLRNSESYSRADSGVLYIDKRYFFSVLPLIKSIHTQIVDTLNDETPLFTLKIAKGLAFAESPIDSTISFGTLRSNLIATAIVKAYFSEFPATEIPKIISQQGYDLEKFYLNPSSKFPYSFD